MFKKKFLKHGFVLILLSVICTFDAACQMKVSPGRIKSLVVTEEKYDEKGTKSFPLEKIIYDNRGNVIEEYKYNDGELESHYSYEYDSNNNKITETEYKKSGEVKKISRYKYENGLRVEKQVFDVKGKLRSKKIYKYTMF